MWQAAHGLRLDLGYGPLSACYKREPPALRRGDCKSRRCMDWADYLREEAAKYRQLAETADDPVLKEELLELAATCEEVANNIEDRTPGG